MSEELIKVNYDWNVINEEIFKERVLTVFKMVANKLAKTLGPYGATTIIEKLGEMHVTKDGWQVVKKIRFDDNINNNIMQLLINISAQVVFNVGDGSTSAIEAGYFVYEYLTNNPVLKWLRSKDFINYLSGCVNIIAQTILANSTKIDINTDPELNDIYKLALISTNGDIEMAGIIQKIYKETKNPTIEYVQSKTNKTSYEIVEGYRLKNLTYIDGIFANHDNGLCVINNPLFLMFDHKIEKEIHYDKIINKAIQIALAENKRLVVVAPNYDKYFLQYIASSINMEYKARGLSTVVYARVSLISNMSNDLYNDFAVMTGGTIIKENNINDLLNDEAISQSDKESDKIAVKAVPDFNISDFIGTTSKVTIGKDNTLIQGFINRNEEMYNVVLYDATSKFKDTETKHRELGVISSDLYEIKQRLSRLKGIMGIINVGGGSSLEKTANFDLVEDAVKACESAYNYGYNIGGNLIIPITIKSILNDPTILFNEEQKIIMNLLSDAFKEIFKIVLSNKYIKIAGSDISSYKDEINNIVEESISRKQCYNLMNSEYNDYVINSCYTDIEILKAASSIVSLLISSNQYISIMVPKEQQDALQQY